MIIIMIIIIIIIIMIIMMIMILQKDMQTAIINMSILPNQIKSAPF